MPRFCYVLCFACLFKVSQTFYLFFTCLSEPFQLFCLETLTVHLLSSLIQVNVWSSQFKCCGGTANISPYIVCSKKFQIWKFKSQFWMMLAIYDLFFGSPTNRISLFQI